MMFSVLMSIYKNDDDMFLRMALESIYEKQTLKPNEIIIVYDGPLTDELYKVVEDFSYDKKDIVRIIPLEKNCGLGEALRIGSKYCTHKYIFRMDSDDLSDSERFLKQISYVEKHPEIDVLGTNIAEFQNSINEEMRVRCVPQHNEGIIEMAKKRNPMNHVTICMKKSALMQCGGYENLLLLEDYYLWLKMIVDGCILENLNESLVYVRIGNGFVSKRGSKTRISGWKKLQEYMLEHRLITKREALFNIIYIWTFVGMPRGIRNYVYSKFLRKRGIKKNE